MIVVRTWSRRCAAAVRCNATSARGSRSGGSGGPKSFWEKWEVSSVGEFHQEVGFSHDKPNDERFIRRSTVRKRAAEFEESDDEYFTTDLPAGPSASEASSQAFQLSAYATTRESLAGADDVDPSRRAELVGLLEDLGPHAFAPVGKMPNEGWIDNTDESELREKQLRSISQFPTYMGGLNARDLGQIPLGAYFAYVLHTRRVTKVNGVSKRMSYSVLVVVGNGKGTAGLGIGKDTAAPVALMKATQAARKSLVHIDRFDDRTIFHDFESFYGPTKVVMLMRRANSGTACNWLAWKILSAFGISDVSCRVHGSKNNINQARCIVNGLMRMDTPQAIAERRGKRALDVTARGNSIVVPQNQQ